MSFEFLSFEFRCFEFGCWFLTLDFCNFNLKGIIFFLLRETDVIQMLAPSLIMDIKSGNNYDYFWVETSSEFKSINDFIS